MTATVAAWLAGLRLPRPVRRWLHPVVACALGFHAFLALSGLDLATYQTGDWTHPGAGDLLMALLKPAVMALALQLDERRELLRNHLTSIGIPVLAGSLATLVFQAWVGRALDLSPAWTLALVPRSVTIPIALPMARQLGADGNLTASVVVVTGLLGAVLGRNLLDRLRISSPVARGVAMGGAAHGLGTATMVAPEPAAGAVAALVYALFGMASASWLAVPWVEVWLRALAG
ncbi:MAG: LrgB family protein [Myxococcota bacterium]